MTNSIAVPPLDFTMPSTPREKRELSQGSDAIKATWLVLNRWTPLITSSALMRHLSTLAPRTRVLFCEMTGKDGALSLSSSLSSSRRQPNRVWRPHHAQHHLTQTRPLLSTVQQLERLMRTSTCRRFTVAWVRCDTTSGRLLQRTPLPCTVQCSSRSGRSLATTTQASLRRP